MIRVGACRSLLHGQIRAALHRVQKLLVLPLAHILGLIERALLSGHPRVRGVKPALNHPSASFRLSVNLLSDLCVHHCLPFCAPVLIDSECARNGREGVGGPLTLRGPLPEHGGRTEVHSVEGQSIMKRLA